MRKGRALQNTRNVAGPSSERHSCEVQVKTKETLVWSFLPTLPFHVRLAQVYLMSVRERDLRMLILSFITCTGVALVNEIVELSSAQLYNTSPVHCVVCSAPKVKSRHRRCNVFLKAFHRTNTFFLFKSLGMFLIALITPFQFYC